MSRSSCDGGKRRWFGTRKFRIVVACLILLSAGTPRGATAAGDPVVAQVGDQTLTAADFRKTIGALDPDTRRKITGDDAALQQLVRAELGRRAILALAHSRRWDRHPDIAARAERAAQDVLITSFLDSVSEPPANFPDDAAVAEFYHTNLTRFLRPRAFHLAQIFLARPASGAKDSADAEARAVALARSTAAPGADFAVLARKYSEDTATAGKGGDLDWIPEKTMVPEIAAAISGLADGETSGAVAAPDGWHILRVLGSRPEAPAPLESVKPTIVAILRQEETTRREQAFVQALLVQGHAEADLDRIRTLFAPAK
jgi:peptidylprolyl isomerase